MHTLRQAEPGNQTDLRTGCATAELILPARPQSARQARTFAESTLRSWSVSDTSNVALVISELTGNAVREEPPGGQGQILLRLGLTVSYVIVQVGDRNPAVPPRPPRRVPARAESGRGLAIALALSRKLCWYSDSGWKIVWAAVFRSDACPRSDTWTWFHLRRDTWTRHRLGRAA